MGLLHLIAASALLLIAAWAQLEVYTEDFSSRPFTNFSGGSYKYSNQQTFPTSTTMSGALFNLNAGGLREVHWHEPNEWAIVLAGTCRATLLMSGSDRPAESWDFGFGDVWYFPANNAHGILGLGPDGCQYLTGYDVADFEELSGSQGLSTWFSTVPPSILAQSMGISQATVQQMIANVIPPENSFIVQGNLASLTANQTQPGPLLALGAAPLTAMAPTQFHRLALGSMVSPQTKTMAGTIATEDVTVLPSALNMSGSFVRQYPNALRQLHWHAEDEWEFLVNGTMELGVFHDNGTLSQSYLQAGDVGFAPKGKGHYLRNLGDTEALLILIFNDGAFTSWEAENVLGQFPLSYFATSSGLPMDFVSSFNVSGAGFLAEDHGTYNASTNSDVAQPLPSLQQ